MRTQKTSATCHNCAQFRFLPLPQSWSHFQPPPLSMNLGGGSRSMNRELRRQRHSVLRASLRQYGSPIARGAAQRHTRVGQEDANCSLYSRDLSRGPDSVRRVYLACWSALRGLATASQSGGYGLCNL